MKKLIGVLKNYLFENPPSPAPQRPSLEGPRDCVLVIDASGSMDETDWSPTRFDAAKEAAVTFTRRLLQEQPDSQVTIVVFACRATIACRITSTKQCYQISSNIDRADVGGSTNIYAGLKLASESFGNRDRICQAVILTDGHNTGKNPENTAEDIKKFATVECVGIGGSPRDVDESLLKKIASSNPDGTKRYRWIGRKEQLVEHFHQLAGGLRRA